MAIGNVTRELRMVASYSYTDAVYEKYPELDPFHPGISDYMAGKPVDGLPVHLASFWAVYTLHDYTPFDYSHQMTPGASYPGDYDVDGVIRHVDAASFVASE